MAESSKRSPIVHKVWTFVVRGGQDFELTLPRNPPLHHDGGMTMWKLVGTQRIANAAREILEETGATVEMHTEVQSEEQRALRMKRLGRGD